MRDTQLDCFCRTCGRHVTLEELQADFHCTHNFDPAELAALQAMRDFLKAPRELN